MNRILNNKINPSDSGNGGQNENNRHQRKPVDADESAPCENIDDYQVTLDILKRYQIKYAMNPSLLNDLKLFYQQDMQNKALLNKSIA